MQEFLSRHASQISGVLRGPDRLIVRGYLQMLSTAAGMVSFLNRVEVPLARFRAYVLGVTTKLITASLARAVHSKRPVIYLGSATTRKEDVARRCLRESPVKEGLICVLKAVEPCKTYELKGSRRGGHVWLEARFGKCQHLYHYFLDRQFGFMSARIQTWFPFTIQIWINGREWLHRRFIEQRVRGYVKEENCFTRLHDAERAQELFDRMLDTSWQSALDEIAQRINPIHREIFADAPQSYYWSLFQSEWAVDVLFKNAAYLQSLFPTLARHAITQMSCADVLRYLERKADGRFRGEILGEFKSRAEGLRVKHWVDGNSLKAYVRGHGHVLRGEFTMNHPDGFKVYRPKRGAEGEAYAWQPLRKGVADLYRRAQVSDQAVGRYLDGLAAVEQETPLKELIGALCRPVRWHGRRLRALAPFSDRDAQLLEAVNRGEFAVSGFRNRDLVPLLDLPSAHTQQHRRRRSAKVTRLLALLRAHGLIRKVPGTHRYLVTPEGKLKITAALAARQTSVAKLVANAA
jgi:hypothetical protein